MCQTQHRSQVGTRTGNALLQVTTKIGVDKARVHRVGGEARAGCLSAMRKLVREQNIRKLALAVGSTATDEKQQR